MLYVPSLSFLLASYAGLLKIKFIDIVPSTQRCFLFLVFFSSSTLQEFSDPRDADDARYNLDGRDVDGRRIIVEFAKGVSLLQEFLIGFAFQLNM